MEISEKIKFYDALANNRPYLGAYKAAFQGKYERHIWMQATIKMLAAQLKQKELHILEIGSWAGGSAITWAKAIKKYVGAGTVTCIDAWRPYFDLSKNSGEVYVTMHNAALDNSIFDLFLHNIRASGLQDMIIPMMGKSKDVFPSLARDRFHLIFIDGSHLYADVKDDIIEAKKLICENGIICGDDLELQADENNLAMVKQNVHNAFDEAKYQNISYHPGVTLAVKEELGTVASWDGYWATQKQNGLWNQVHLEELQSFDLEHFADRPTSARLVEDIGPYNIVSISNGIYVAVAKLLGAIDFDKERIGERDLDPWVFTSNSLEIIREKVRKKLGLSGYVTP